VYSLSLPVVMRNFIAPVPCAPRLITEIETGPEPYMVALDTAGRRAFVAHMDGVTVIDMNGFAIITATHSPTLAHGIAYDSDRDHIWVTRRNPDRVIVLDGATYAPLVGLPAGEAPHGIAYNPANSRVYVTNYWSETVMVYNAETLTVVEELTGFGEPAHLAVNPVSNKVYVANHEPNRGVIVIDGATHDVYPIGTTLLDAYGVTVDTTRNLVYATGIAQGRVVIIDGDTDAQVGGLDIRDDGGQAVWLRVIAVNPNVGSEGHLLLVTSSNDGEPDQLLLIPNGWPTLGTPVALDIASYPQEGIVVDPNQDRVWVTSVSSGLVSVIQDGEPVCSP
jgi:YVTN family beta-propeller protein